MDFSLPVAAPPWTQVGKRLESSLRKAILQFDMLANAPRIAIALSGGKDSLSLLFLLKAVCGRGLPAFDLHAIHVSGEFSCGAAVHENFIQRICRRLEVPLHVVHSQQKLEKLECYSCSRERRKLLFDTAKAIEAPVVAFGHHRDDSIQTLLLNLLHKGEFAANLPVVHMQKYGVTIIRPLILATENDIRAFAQHYGFARITCQCPVGQNSKRKQVEKLICQLEDAFPNVRANLSHAGMEYGSHKAATP